MSEYVESCSFANRGRSLWHLEDAVTVTTAPDTDGFQDQLRAMERDRLRAFVACDLDTLAGLHSDDFQLINPSGQEVSKADYLRGIASGDIRYLVWDITSDIAVRLMGEAAALRYQATIEIIVGGTRFTFQCWHLDLYERRNERWQVVWSQATAIQ